MFKVMTIFGIRPEAIKLAPVLVELRKLAGIDSCICVTGQHRQMLDQLLSVFGIVPDVHLDLMHPDQGLSDLTARVITQVDKVMTKIRPDLVVVQGDTTTTMAAAAAVFYNNVCVAHVEAGLRTKDISSPFPEEFNPRVTSLLAMYHFAPTSRTRQPLLKEGVPESAIFLTSNPVIDALHMILSKPRRTLAQSLPAEAGINGRSDAKKLILVTAHRRENFGMRTKEICLGSRSLARRNEHDGNGTRCRGFWHPLRKPED